MLGRFESLSRNFSLTYQNMILALPRAWYLVHIVRLLIIFSRWWAIFIFSSAMRLFIRGGGWGGRGRVDGERQDDGKECNRTKIVSDSCWAHTWMLAEIHDGSDHAVELYRLGWIYMLLNVCPDAQNGNNHIKERPLSIWPPRPPLMFVITLERHKNAISA